MFTPQPTLTAYAERLIRVHDERRRLLLWAAQRHADADSTPPLWHKIITPDGADTSPAIPDACAK
ncbi:MAG: hypothetical protein AB9869_37280 [Verrucomicrobiia bacterium]